MQKELHQDSPVGSRYRRRKGSLIGDG